jgi:RloB-like protein
MLMKHPRLQDALVQARDNAISLAVSSPCFELWVLLHFEDCGRHTERDEVVVRLRKHLQGYEKILDYATVAPQYEMAKRRAAMLEQAHVSAGSTLPAIRAQMFGASSMRSWLQGKLLPRRTVEKLVRPLRSLGSAWQFRYDPYARSGLELEECKRPSGLP